MSTISLPPKGGPDSLLSVHTGIGTIGTIFPIERRIEWTLTVGVLVDGTNRVVALCNTKCQEDGHQPVCGASIRPFRV
jgi:hypothetical protein